MNLTINTHVSIFGMPAPRDFLVVYIFLFFFFNLKENPSEREHDGARTEARAVLILYNIPR